MKKLLSILAIALFIPQLVFGFGLQGFIGDEENFPHGVTFVGIYDDNLTADISTGSATSIFTASRGASNPKTYFDSSGVMQKTETSDVGAINHGWYDRTGWHLYTHAGYYPESVGTNYLTDTMFHRDGDSDGLADNWTYSEYINGTPTITLLDVSSTFNVGTTVQAQRIVYTGVAADSGRWFNISSLDTPVGSFTQNDYITLSVWVKGPVSGVSLSLRITQKDSEGVIGTTATTRMGVTLPSEWRRYTKTLWATDSDLSMVNIALGISYIDEGDSIDIQFACVQVEKSRHATSYIPTTTATLTRNLETLKYETAGNRTAAVETMVVKFSAAYKDSDTDIDRWITETETKRRGLSFYESGNKLFFYPNITDSPDSTVEYYGYNTANTEITIVVSNQHSSPFAEMFIDDSSVDTETSNDYTDPNWGTYFHVGNNSSGAGQFNGVILAIGFWGRILSDAETLFLREKDWRTLR